MFVCGKGKHISRGKRITEGFEECTQMSESARRLYSLTLPRSLQHDAVEADPAVAAPVVRRAELDVVQLIRAVAAAAVEAVAAGEDLAGRLAGVPLEVVRPAPEVVFLFLAAVSCCWCWCCCVVGVLRCWCVWVCLGVLGEGEALVCVWRLCARVLELG